MKHLMGWVVSWLLVVLATGCEEEQKGEPGDPIDAEVEAPHSGSRLKLRWMDFDGDKIAAGWVDSQRAEVCAPVPWLDGKVYCTPEARREIVYQDAECKVPLGKYTRQGIDTQCDPVNPYFLIESSDGCRSLPQRLHRGNVNLTATSYYAKRYGVGACEEAGLGSNEVLYDLGAEIPASALVEISPVAATAKAGRLQLQYGATQDGASVLLGTHDEMLDGVCEFRRSPDGQALSCLPDAKLADLYGDAACTEPLTSAGASCKPAKYIATNDLSCPDNWRLRGVGEAHAQAVYYQSPVCSLVTPAPVGINFFKTLAPVAAARMKRAAVISNGARIAPVFYSNGTLRKGSELLRDTQLETDCAATQLRDGTTRCLPDESNVGMAYTDPSCTNPIRIAVLSTCRTAPPKFMATKSIAACRTDVTVYPVGEKYDGPLYQPLGPARCERLPGEFVAYRAAEAVSLEQFARATFVVDP